MSLWVFDTDHVTLHQHAHPLVVQRCNAVAPDSLAVTIITVEEQLRGRLSIIKKYASMPKQALAYAAFHATLDYFSRITILDFDRSAYDQYRALREQKLRIGSQDLRIAAIVLSLNETLVTRNQRDFAHIAGLTIQDWSVP